MMNFLDMFGKLKGMQDAMKKTKEQLDQLSIEGSAGGGMVKVIVNGNRKLLKIEIDPAIINKEDPEMMADLIAAAVNQAMDKADAVSKEEIGKVTKEFMPNIPGFDPSKLGF